MKQKNIMSANATIGTSCGMASGEKIKIRSPLRGMASGEKILK